MNYWYTALSSTKKKIVLILSTILIGVIAVYGYFLQQTINTVVNRSHIEQEITQLRSQIGDAERSFGTNIGSATLQKAKKLGFERTRSARFVTRNALDTTLVTANVQNE